MSGATGTSSVLASYLITCLTEQLRVVSPFVYTVPTTCPNNTAHTIDPSQTILYKTLAPKNVTVLEQQQVVSSNMYVSQYSGDHDPSKCHQL